MKTNVLSKIKTSLCEVVRHYPIELLLSITFFVIYCCVSDKGGLVFYVLLLFPVFFVLTYVFHRFAEAGFDVAAARRLRVDDRMRLACQCGQEPQRQAQHQGDLLGMHAEPPQR